ncbi:tripartite-type tricarboxylate transporter receptor subunit TctC [Bradyrhizobium algeriense]|uniref:Tripartite-type tricarboxylate transporter receptor subunit TctC n=1 Tax=Bradyrhizobium algeriense TaxID=634784 RepID=A0ABU8BHN9_9BRAD
MLQRRHRYFLVLLSLLAVALSANPCAVSAQAFPAQPVYIVVPFAAGGVLDSLTRLIAEQLQAKWRQAVIVENRVGASGNVGAAYVGQSRADGYTLLASPPPPLAVNQFLFRSLTFKPSDFAVATVLARSPNVLVANPKLKASNLPELIALAKASPGKLNYASTGRGGTPHLTMEWLKLETGIDLVHVPYARGYPQALTDLVGGQVDLMFVNLSDAKQLIQSGQLKAIAVADANPIKGLTDVSPISRQIPGFTSLTWFAIAAPRATPRPIVEQISADVVSAMKSPMVADRLKALSLTLVETAPAEASSFVEEEAERWHKVINRIGLQPE